MKRSSCYALFTIFLLALFLRFYPLFNTLYWGADYGEYYYLSKELVVGSHISSQYFGWGAVYPDFPGMEILSSSMGIMSNTSLVFWLSIIAPLLASLSVIFIFLIAVEVFKDDRVGLVAAGFVAVVLPHVYPTSHPMPGSIGDLLFIVCLLFFIKMQNNKKHFAPLLVFSVALIMTHHLSTYFLLICIMAAIFIKVLFQKKPELKNYKLSFTYLGAFVSVFLLYWSLSANFKDRLLGNFFPWWYFLFIIPGALALLGFFVYAKAKMNWRIPVGYPSSRWLMISFSLVLTTIIIIILILIFIGIPGTTMKIPYISFFIFMPFIIFISFGGPGRAPSDFYRGGAYINGWMVAIVVSLFIGAIVAPAFLIPYRHIEYLVIPLSFFVGLGTVFIYDRLGSGIAKINSLGKVKNKKSNRKHAAMVLLVIFLLAGNALFTYPSRDLMLGYNEGTGAKSLEGVIWVKFNTREDTSIASDHRLSAIVFGFAERNASWERTPLALKADSFEDARDQMLQAPLPSGIQRIEYVILDNDVKEGAIMLVWEVAEPLSPEALAKFESSSYTKLYDNGFTQLYMVNW